jgi:type I restriction enzyme S subunit
MRKVEFGEIATFSQGQQVSIPDQKTEKFDGCDTFLRIVNYTQNSDDFRYIPKQSHKHHVSTDDIFIVRYGAVGFVGRGLSGVLANNMFKINFDKDQVDGNYLFRTLWSDFVQKQLLNASQSTSMAAINFKTTSKITIPLHPLDQQKKIASILDAAYAYKQKTKALIEKYDELTQSLFIDIFGDPVGNPKGWESSKLGLIVENKDSKRKPVKSSDRENMDGDYPYYGASGIIDYVNWFTHEGDNLLIGEDGANLLARSKPIAFIAKGQYWVNNHAHVLGFNGKALLVFIEFFINLIDLSNYVTGSAQPKLNRKNMDQIKIFCPTIELQNQFADSVKAIEAQKAQAQASLAQAEDLFNSLLQRAFKGELV